MNYILRDKYLDIEIKSLFVKSINDFFNGYIPSKKYQHLLIQNKWILIDGKACKRDSELVGDTLSILIYPEEYNYINNELKPDVVYEDEIIAILNKPKGMLVHSDGNDNITLTDYLRSYYSDRSYLDTNPIHRLDFETTGLVMYSKSPIFQPLLDKLLADNQIRRYYLAFVKGKIKRGENLIIDKPIGKDRHNPNKRIVYKDGQSALTKAKCLGNKNGISILRCYLGTGRTHQIRVHLSHIGYPIINDDLYGINDKSLIRMGLIGDELEFYHPLKETSIKIECPLPNDMARVYNEVID